MVDLLIAWLGNVPEAIWGALATAALGGVGYVVKRHIDQRPQLTTIEKAKHLLDLSDGLKKSGTSFDELQRLEQRIMTKTTRRKDNKKGLEEEVKAATKEDTKELLTQYEMNKHSYDAFKVADAKLRYIITSLEILLGDKELGDSAWLKMPGKSLENFRQILPVLSSKVEPLLRL